MKTRDEILTEAANGNDNALAFLRAWATRVHWIDDLADRDALDRRPEEWYLPGHFSTHEVEWLTTIVSNPFFLAHQQKLLPTMLASYGSWVDSHGFPAEQQSVLKAQWHEVVWIVALLTGGYNHMRKVAATNRQFDVDVVVPISSEAVCPCCGVSNCRHDKQRKEREAHGTLRT